MAFARGQLSLSHEIMAANDWKRRQEAGAFNFHSAGEVNFLSQYSSYFSHLKELEEGPAHGLCFSVFLSSPSKMFCTDHFNL